MNTFREQCEKADLDALRKSNFRITEKGYKYDGCFSEIHCNWGLYYGCLFGHDNVVNYFITIGATNFDWGLSGAMSRDEKDDSGRRENLITRMKNLGGKPIPKYRFTFSDIKNHLKGEPGCNIIFDDDIDTKTLDAYIKRHGYPRK